GVELLCQCALVRGSLPPIIFLEQLPELFQILFDRRGLRLRCPILRRQKKKSRDQDVGKAHSWILLGGPKIIRREYRCNPPHIPAFVDEVSGFLVWDVGMKKGIPILAVGALCLAGGWFLGRQSWGTSDPAPFEIPDPSESRPALVRRAQLLWSADANQCDGRKVLRFLRSL